MHVVILMWLCLHIMQNHLCQDNPDDIAKIADFSAQIYDIVCLESLAEKFLTICQS